MQAHDVTQSEFLEVFMDEVQVTRCRPAFFVGYKHEWGVVVRTSLNYYPTYEKALEALNKRSYIKLTDPVRTALTTFERPETMRARQ